MEPFVRDDEIILSQFKLFYFQLAPALIFHARKYVDRQTAEDLVQDIFLKAWNKKMPSFTTEGVKAYMFRSVQNACLDYLRHQSIEEDFVNKTIIELKIEEAKFNDDITNRIIFEEKLEAVHKQIDQLPEQCKIIFKLSYLEEKKNAEIADDLNLSVRTVETQIYKALKILRNSLSSLIIALFFLLKKLVFMEK